MLIASAFKRPVMWSSAGFVQVGRSNQLFLLLINITWPAIISLLSSLFFASPSIRSLARLYLFLGVPFFILFNISHRTIPEVKIFSISSLLMVRSQSYRRQKIKKFVKKVEERDTRDERRAFNLFSRNPLCTYRN